MSLGSTPTYKVREIGARGGLRQGQEEKVGSVFEDRPRLRKSGRRKQQKRSPERDKTTNGSMQKGPNRENGALHELVDVWITARQKDRVGEVRSTTEIGLLAIAMRDGLVLTWSRQDEIK